MNYSKTDQPGSRPEGLPAPATDAPDLFEAPPAPAGLTGAPGLALPPRIDPSALRREEQRILPSGRAVQMRRLTTKEYLDAKERAAGLVGEITRTNPDPQGRRTSALEEREMMALCITAYTDPFDWTPWMEEQLRVQQAAWEKEHPATDGQPAAPYIPNLDPVALLDRLPPGAWRSTTPFELLTPGDRSLESIFTEVADWAVLVATGSKMLLPTRDFSAIVGKARTVVR